MQKFYRSDNRLIWGDNDRKPKQRGRQRQRERQKTNRFRMSKQQHAFFVHFIAGLRRENALFHVLSRGR